MHDVADQIRAWADAAAPTDAAPRVRSDDVVSLAERSVRRRPPRLIAAAAVVIFVAVLAALVVATNRDDPQSVTAGPTDDTTEANPVAFEVLSVADGSDLNDLGVLRSATSPVELTGLWDVAGASGPVPSIDFGEQVVVSITIPDGACESTLDGFDRDGVDIIPRFVRPARGCGEAADPRTYVAALDRSTTGPEFRLVLAGDTGFEFGQTFLHVGGEVPGAAGASAAFHLSADTMAAGSTIAGTVQVYNNAEEAIERTTCGAYFVAVLEGDAATQLYSRPRCNEAFVIPPGSSSYPITAKATYLTCINGEASELVPACLPDGTMPPMPAGTYEVEVDQPDDSIEVSGLTVTVT